MFHHVNQKQGPEAECDGVNHSRLQMTLPFENRDTFSHSLGFVPQRYKILTRLEAAVPIVGIPLQRPRIGEGTSTVRLSRIIVSAAWKRFLFTNHSKEVEPISPFLVLCHSSTPLRVDSEIRQRVLAVVTSSVGEFAYTV